MIVSQARAAGQWSFSMTNEGQDTVLQAQVGDYCRAPFTVRVPSQISVTDDVRDVLEKLKEIFPEQSAEILKN